MMLLTLARDLVATRWSELMIHISHQLYEHLGHAQTSKGSLKSSSYIYVMAVQKKRSVRHIQCHPIAVQRVPGEPEGCKQCGVGMGKPF